MEEQTFPEVRERRKIYNTRCLAHYLEKTSIIDPDHIAKAETNLADLKQAGEDAISAIIQRSGSSDQDTYLQERIDLIRQLTRCK